MGIFDFLKGKQSDGEGVEGAAAAELRTRRFHARYSINDNSLCLIEHDTCGAFRVVDLSYKGCLVEAAGEQSLDAIQGPIKVSLSIFGHKIALEVSEVQKRRSGWGLIFNHPDERFFMTLTNIVEPLRRGSTAISVAQDPSRDGMKARLRRRFQGDGPFDFIIERDVSANVTFGMVTMRQADVYSSVIWEHGLVITKKSVDKTGVGARMSQTQQPEKELVLSAAIACLGMKFPEGEEMARILGEWLKRA